MSWFASPKWYDYWIVPRVSHWSLFEYCLIFYRSTLAQNKDLFSLPTLWFQLIFKDLFQIYLLILLWCFTQFSGRFYSSYCDSATNILYLFIYSQYFLFSFLKFYNIYFNLFPQCQHLTLWVISDIQLIFIKLSITRKVTIFKNIKYLPMRVLCVTNTLDIFLFTKGTR